MPARLFRFALPALAAIALFGAAGSNSASAAPSTAPVVSATATANAATVTLAGSSVTTGSCTAAPLSLTGPCGPVESIPTPGVLSAGLFVQQAGASVIAFAGQPPLVASSSACAGAVGAGGTIQIGDGGSCLAAIDSPSGGVVVDLGAATLRADAITAACTASSVGPPTAQVELVNATISPLNPLSPPVSLTAKPGPNTTVAGLGGLVDVTLNARAASQAPGTIAATALNITVATPGAPQPTLHVTIGTVSCGPDAVTAPVSSSTTVPVSPTSTVSHPSTTPAPTATAPTRAVGSVSVAGPSLVVVSPLPVTG